MISSARFKLTSWNYLISATHSTASCLPSTHCLVWCSHWSAEPSKTNMAIVQLFYWRKYLL